jgi:homoserine kinase
MKNSVKVFAPATVANICCGFDVLGLALEAPGDEIVLYPTDEPGVRIVKIEGAELPFDIEQNVAGKAAASMLKACGSPFGIEMEIYKGIKPGSGIGSSAASAAAAIEGVRALLKQEFTPSVLIEWAMDGEFLASGARHADNVAPALLGGIVLMQGYNPLNIIELPVPEQLHVVIIHPQISIRTSEARKILPTQVDMKDAIQQSANLGGLVAALYLGDMDLLSATLVDLLAEPYRKTLIPGFELVKEAAMIAGALGGGISGSGPSMFWICKNAETAEQVQQSIHNVFKKSKIKFNIHSGKIAREGARVTAVGI